MMRRVVLGGGMGEGSGWAKPRRGLRRKLGGLYPPPTHSLRNQIFSPCQPEYKPTHIHQRLLRSNSPIQFKLSRAQSFFSPTSTEATAISPRFPPIDPRIACEMSIYPIPILLSICARTMLSLSYVEIEKHWRD